MTYLKHQNNYYQFADFKNHNVYVSNDDFYDGLAMNSSIMNLDNTEGSNLVCIATYRNPNFEKGGFNYFYYHVGFYSDVKDFLNLKFEEHDDNWFIFIPVNDNGQDIVDKIKSFCTDCKFVDLPPR